MKAATPYYPCTTRPVRGVRVGSFAAHLQRRVAAARSADIALDDAPGQAVPAIEGAAVPQVEARGGAPVATIPHVLLIDEDAGTADAVSALLMPEARVIHAATLAEARLMLGRHIFALVVIDPVLPDGDAAALLPMLRATPVVVHARREPVWRDRANAFLPKPWTTPRDMWSAISRLLGVPTDMSAGD
ncbi:MAG: hypothetical protein ACXWVD_03275 [Telluria sp.]